MEKPNYWRLLVSCFDCGHREKYRVWEPASMLPWENKCCHCDSKDVATRYERDLDRGGKTWSRKSR